MPTIKFSYFISFIIIFFIILTICESKAIKSSLDFSLTEIIGEDDERVNHSCVNLPPTVLTDVLGAAFNSRYMSIEKPNYFDETSEMGDNYSYLTNKRKADSIRPFYVDDTYALEISNKPAWEVKHTMDSESGAATTDSRAKREVQDNAEEEEEEESELVEGDDRAKRTAYKSFSSKFKNSERPWECEAIIKWIDLGINYFPRFLRTVECTKHVCWYGHYTCKPRSFTVKILRRRNGECVPSDSLNNISSDDLPGELKELWVWEERAVNFCCDCAAG